MIWAFIYWDFVNSFLVSYKETVRLVRYEIFQKFWTVLNWSVLHKLKILIVSQIKSNQLSITTFVHCLIDGSMNWWWLLYILLFDIIRCEQYFRNQVFSETGRYIQWYFGLSELFNWSLVTSSCWYYDVSDYNETAVGGRGTVFLRWRRSSDQEG